MKKIVVLLMCFLSVFVFSACSLTGGTSTSSQTSAKKTANFLKSSDGGKNWENKITIDQTKNIGTVNVLSMAVHPADSAIVYIGTEKDGLYVTRDGAEKWEKLVFPLTRIYGLALDKNDTQIVYASGIFNKRAKIFKSTNAGTNWTEVYTEPSDGSVISSLEISKKNPNVLYAGTSEGMIFKTQDGGSTWKNVIKASGPVISISFDATDDNTLYFGVFNGSALRTRDGGALVEDVKKIKPTVEGSKNWNGNTYSVSADPQIAGRFYVGTNKGLFRFNDFGNTWEELNVLESSKKFPIRSVAVNPKNSNELVYSIAGVIYQTQDNGQTWDTFQLNTANVVQVIRYDYNNPSTVYAGLRKP